jgi:drug/metabolite transporter (DMT)-like permease
MARLLTAQLCENVWLPLFALAAISQVARQGLIVCAFAHLPTTFGALNLLLQPMLAALVAWALFGEAIVNVEILGGIIVLTAVLIARLDVKKER